MGSPGSAGVTLAIRKRAATTFPLNFPNMVLHRVLTQRPTNCSQSCIRSCAHQPIRVDPMMPVLAPMPLL